MSLDYCETCPARVPTSDLQPVLEAAATHGSPAQYAMACPKCRGEDDRDEDYERAASRARSNDFARTGGKDWT